jgi:hypothetical protein
MVKGPGETQPVQRTKMMAWGCDRGRERMPERPRDLRKDHVSIPANQSAAFELFYVSTRLGSSISGEVDAISESVSNGVGMQSSKLFNQEISGR